MSENTSDEPVDEPTADDPPDRTLSWWPLLAAAVVAAVFLTILFTVGSDGDSGPGTERDDNGALSCPKTYDKPKNDILWVPAGPSGVDGKKSLLPDTAPSHVTLCSYRSGQALGAQPLKLRGHRTVDDGLRALAKELSEARRLPGGKITTAYGSEQGVFLLGATFATGFVWVAVTDDSSASPTITATNGEFETQTSLYKRVARAYQTRSW